jgi:LysM repeat protein
MDLLLVLAVLALILVWWQIATRPVAGPTAPPVGEVAPGPVAEPVQGEEDPALAPTLANPAEVELPTVTIHRVISGETLLSISTQYGVTVADIQAANGMESVLIRVGDELVIPIPEAVTEASALPTLSTAFSYDVQQGDTIVSIAIRFGAQIESILSANNLRASDFIQPGQRLRIPVEQVPTAVITSSDQVRGLPANTRTYDAVRVIAPQSGEVFSDDREILFRWISVDLLAPNEWYVLRIWPLEGTTVLPPTVWTKTTSHRMTTDWAPAGRTARYGWQVNVIRVLPDEGTGREIQTASALSEVRTFRWE